MLLGILEDLKNDDVIAKAVSVFGIMVSWRANLAAVIVRVSLNDDRKIPSSVVVGAGLPLNGKTWTVAVYTLKRGGVVVLPDPDAPVLVGPLHPMKPDGPRWDGPIPPAGSDLTPANSNVDNLVMQVDGAGNGVHAHQCLVGQFGGSVLGSGDHVNSVPQNVVLPQSVTGRVPILQDGNLIIRGSDFDSTTETDPLTTPITKALQIVTPVQVDPIGTSNAAALADDAVIVDSVLNNEVSETSVVRGLF